MRAVLLAGAVLLGAGGAAAADPAGPRHGARFTARIGSVAAPFYTEGLPVVRSEFQAYTLVGEAFYDLTPWRVGARLPVTTSTIEQPAGSYAADYTTGNPELYGERRLASSAGRSSRLGGAAGELRVRLGAALPLAGRGPDASLLRNRVVAASDAIEGWRHPELYQVGVLPLVASGHGELEAHRWRLFGQLKTPLFLRTSSAGLPPEARTRPVGLLPVFLAGGSWRPLAWVAVGATAAITAHAAAPVVPLRDIGRSGAVQMTVAPQIQLVGERFSLELDLLFAVGGPLDGTIGLGLHLGWQGGPRRAATSARRIPGR